MALVPARCTQCNALLEVDSAKDAANCVYCGTAFVVEKAINNYATHQQNTFNIGNANIQVQDSSSPETKLANAEVFLTSFCDYEKAEELFREVTQEAPGDYRGWWGVVRARTRDLDKDEFGYVLSPRLSNSRLFKVVVDDLFELGTFYSNALRVAPPEVDIQLETAWTELTGETLTKLKAELETNIERAQNRVNSASSSDNNYYEMMRNAASKVPQKDFKDPLAPIGCAIPFALIAWAIISFMIGNKEADGISVFFLSIMVLAVIFCISFILSKRNDHRIEYQERVIAAQNEAEQNARTASIMAAEAANKDLHEWTMFPIFSVRCRDSTNGSPKTGSRW